MTIGLSLCWYPTSLEKVFWVRYESSSVTSSECFGHLRCSQADGVLITTTHGLMRGTAVR